MADEIYTQLDTLLADYTTYSQKLRSYHWNVKGKRFFQLHEEFEQLYDQAGLWSDKIAERIVQLDERPTGTLAGVVQKTRLEEAEKTRLADEMVRDLISDIERLQTFKKELIDNADEEGDVATCNLLEDIVEAQEVNRWMLSAWLKEK